VIVAVKQIKWYSMFMKKVIIASLLIAATFVLGGCSLFEKDIETSSTIPQNILDNQFGFLGGGPDEDEFIEDFEYTWSRPHPGPFLWDEIQDSAYADFDFGNVDKEVKKLQNEDLGILATIWPFADWDQESRPECKVSDNDEFLPKFFGPGRYLPHYRCNPTDWQAYQSWITTMVERYDGDGIDDMPNLRYPIKHWEVMNEPDLQPDETARLQFYRETANDYADLLIKTSQYIKQADSEAQVLIAGASGGNNDFLDFWRKVFNNKSVAASFDIANVHCISNDSYESYNVDPYLKMLTEFGLENKPIWVTEAEAMVHEIAEKNEQQTIESTENALELGAKKIFYTTHHFEPKLFGNEEPKPGEFIDDNNKGIDNLKNINSY